jgi:hypothetical protein
VTQNWIYRYPILETGILQNKGVQEFRSSGVQEFRSSGVQEFRRILKERTCLEIGATSQVSNAYNPPLKILESGSPLCRVRIAISFLSSELLNSSILNSFQNY